MTQYLLLGHIAQIRGLQGHVIVQLASPLQTIDPLEFIFIQMGHTYVPYQAVDKALLNPYQIRFKLAGITDRSIAKEMVGKGIWLPQELLSKLVGKSANPEEDIVGYHVTDVVLGELGIVKHIEVLPMHLCLAVDYQSKELLIPYVGALIKKIDHAKREIKMKLPQGFLEAMGF